MRCRVRDDALGAVGRQLLVLDVEEDPDHHGGREHQDRADEEGVGRALGEDLLLRDLLERLHLLGGRLRVRPLRCRGELLAAVGEGLRRHRRQHGETERAADLLRGVEDTRADAGLLGAEVVDGGQGDGTNVRPMPKAIR